MNLNLAKDDPAYKQLHILLKEKLSERMDSVDDSLPTYILHIAVAMNKSKPEVVSALDFVQPEIAKTIVDWMWNNFKEYAKLQSAKEEEGGSLAGKRSKRSSKEATVKKKLEADKKDSTVIDKNVKRRSVLKKGKECNGSLDIEGGKEEKHKIESTTASPLVRPSVSFRVVPKRKPPAESKEEDALPTTQPNPDTKQIRCRYWPNCANGKTCPYFHPHETCKKFPACEYGDRCLCIHPQIPCKFGVYCARPDCAFLHPVQPPIVYPMPYWPVYDYSGACNVHAKFPGRKE
eukprot:TRINITY_DN715_c0_g1_i1.p1 TRINITY_DN715_c0_g1~~TRINITY_DN715_c0_g1_i1.p1  ORF type:complete len:290 (+),score=62.13 TRINITY_DN715_c0_g1_i1:124-993(+)